METENSFKTVSLTKRELEVLQLLSTGLQNNEIADKFGYSKSHVDKMLSRQKDPRSIYRKIDVANAKEAVNWYLNRQNAETEVRNQELQSQNAKLATRNIELKNDNSELRTQLSQFAVQNKRQFIFLSYLGISIIGVILIAFLPFIVPSKSLEQYLLNVYIVVPLAVGVYGVKFYSERLDSRFFLAFFIVSVGLISWFVGGVIWLVLDLIKGLEPHYISYPEPFYLLQTLTLVLSFFLWWHIFCRPARNSISVWLTFAVSLFIFYNLVALFFREIHSFHDIWQPILAMPFPAVIEIVYAIGDSVSFAFAISLLRSKSLARLSSPRRFAIRLLSWGMGAMFMTDLAFVITNHLPEDSPMYYGGGGWPDLIYLFTFSLMGLGIVLGSTNFESFEDLLG